MDESLLIAVLMGGPGSEREELAPARWKWMSSQGPHSQGAGQSTARGSAAMESPLSTGDESVRAWERRSFLNPVGARSLGAGAGRVGHLGEGREVHVDRPLGGEGQVARQLRTHAGVGQ